MNEDTAREYGVVIIHLCTDYIVAISYKTGEVLYRDNTVHVINYLTRNGIPIVGEWKKD